MNDVRSAIQTALNWPTINAKDYGVKGDGTPEDADLLEGLINGVVPVENAHSGLEIYFPGGTYLLPRTINIARDDYFSWRLRLRGDGKHVTTFRAGGSEDFDLFRFTNTGGYTYRLAFHGLGFLLGDAAIRADHLFYSEIIDCAFKQTGQAGSASIHLNGNSNDCLIHDISAIHSGDVLFVDNGTVMVSDSRFGEDCGGIRVDGNIVLTGCKWKDGCHDRAQPMGRFGAGPAALTVDGDGTALVTGCYIGVAAGAAFVNADNTGGVHLADNLYKLKGGAIVRSRRTSGDRGISVAGGIVQMFADGPLWQAVSGFDPTGCSIVGLRVISRGHTATVPAAMVNPTSDNIVYDNFATLVPI